MTPASESPRFLTTAISNEFAVFDQVEYLGQAAKRQLLAELRSLLRSLAEPETASWAGLASLYIHYHTLGHDGLTSFSISLDWQDTDVLHTAARWVNTERGTRASGS